MRKPCVNTNIDFDVKLPRTKIIFFLFPIFVILFFTIYPIFVFMGSGSDIKTETAVYRRIYRGIETDAFVVRKEEYVNNIHSGTVVPTVVNGDKVAIGDTVAKIYSDDVAAGNAARLAEIKNEIAYFRYIEANSSVMAARPLQSDIYLYKNNVADSLFSLSSSINGNILSEIYKKSRVLREAITLQQIAVGGRIDVSEKLERLQSEYNSLKNVSSSDVDIRARETGYYVLSSDGYENSLDYASIRDISCSEITDVLSASPDLLPEGNVGKIISNFNWYLVCRVSAEKLVDIDMGDTVTVIFSNSSVGELKMKVVKINLTDDGEMAALVLCSNEMNENISAVRFVSIKIRIKEFGGYVVDKQAIRTVDGETGVYVKLGNIVKFKKINIVYSDDNIILVDNLSNSGSYLRLYDEIITEGTELYDGKILD